MPSLRFLNHALLANFVTFGVVFTAFGQVREIDLVIDPGTPAIFSESKARAHLQEVEALITPPLAVPERITVQLGDRFGDSVFDRATFHLYAGFKKDPAHWATLTHEYGHAILETSLLKNVPAYHQFHKNAVTLAEDRKAQKPGVDRTQKLFIISKALHEFFADVVAVTVHQDPQALRKFTEELSKDKTEGSWDDLITRDFETSPTSPRRLQWETLLPFATFTNDVYFALLPSRWAYWDLAKEKIVSQKGQQEMLRRAYRAVEAVMSEAFNWSEPELGGKKLEPALMKRLNEKLQKNLEDPYEP